MRIQVEVPRVGNAAHIPRAVGVATLPQQSRGDSRGPPEPQLKELPPGWTRHIRFAADQRRYEYYAPDFSARAGSVADAWRRHRGERPAAGRHKPKATRPAGVLSQLTAHRACSLTLFLFVRLAPLASPARLTCSPWRNNLLRGGDGRRSDGEGRGGWTEWRRRGRRMGGGGGGGGGGQGGGSVGACQVVPRLLVSGPCRLRPCHCVVGSCRRRPRACIALSRELLSFVSL